MDNHNHYSWTNSQYLSKRLNCAAVGVDGGNKLLRKSGTGFAGRRRSENCTFQIDLAIVTTAAISFYSCDCVIEE